ncbi:hypothetical protein GJ496_005687 [Pomphorhynchus laevis]|nr:hypothetical protein GJ496_005687 [Pomphorhynchus laevis]
MQDPAIAAKLVRKGMIGKAARLLEVKKEWFQHSTKYLHKAQRPGMLDLECIDNEMRRVIGLPLRYGGMGIREIGELGDIEFCNSKSLSILILEGDTGIDQRSRQQSIIEQIRTSSKVRTIGQHNHLIECSDRDMTIIRHNIIRDTIANEQRKVISTQMAKAVSMALRLRTVMAQRNEKCHDLKRND